MSENKIERFKLLGGFCTKTYTTRFVNVSEFIDDFAELAFGNGGGWARFDGSFGKKYKVCKVRKSGESEYSWIPTKEELIQIEKDIEKEKIQLNNVIKIEGLKGINKITLLKIYGCQEKDHRRSIREDIRRFYKDKSCIVCGSRHQIEIDHKNSLYNDVRVMNIQTQKLSDFQPLCKHCNDQKRYASVWQKNNGKRYPASLIPQLSVFGIDYTIGDETLDFDDIDALIGTYWYDPVEFMKQIKNKIQNSK